MPSSRSRIQLYCPSCGHSLTEQEQRKQQCSACGHVINLKNLQSKHKDQMRQEAADKRAIIAEWLAGMLGSLAIILGIVLICASEAGPAQLLSRMGMSISVLSFVIFAHRKINEEPLYPALFVLGVVWLFAGLFFYGLF